VKLARILLRLRTKNEEAAGYDVRRTLEGRKRMRTKSIGTGTAFLFLLATGCATTGDLESAESRLAELEGRVGQLEQQFDGVEARANAAEQAAERAVGEASSAAQRADDAARRADAMFQKSVSK
jgi:outer membrane murein-binding lipoprotein Lpp